jgi:para-nitrobenzyl esterase
LHGLSKTPRGAMLASFASDKDKKTIGLVQDYWTNFAKTGDPNGAGLPEWPSSTDAAPQTMVFNDDSKAAAGFRDKQLDVIYYGWNERTGDPIP